MLIYLKQYTSFRKSYDCSRPLDMLEYVKESDSSAVAAIAKE